MGRVFGAIGKVLRPVAGAIGRVVNFIPNQLGKIPVVGKFLKFGASLLMGAAIPGLGWGGMLGKMGGLGAKLGGLGSKMAGLAGKLPGAGKVMGMASKAKNWGSRVFTSGKNQFAKLPKWGQQAVKETKSLPQTLQQRHQQAKAGEQAAVVAQYMAMNQLAATGALPFGAGGAYFA